MEKMKLNGNWELRSTSEDEYMPAKVPGSVYQAYLDNGRMEDPYYRDNEMKALELMKQDFEYRTGFDVPESLLGKERVILRFEGIDTVGDVWLNGTFLGRADNMHRTWEYPVKELLRQTGNELRVVLTSPVNYIYDLYEKDPHIMGSTDAMNGSPYLRKAHCMYGWDWGPRLPDAGIWRDVLLFGADRARIDNVYVTQRHSEGQVVLQLKVEAEVFGQKGLCRIGGTAGNAESGETAVQGYALHTVITAPDGSRVEAGGSTRILIENPRLWWPNGYGEQPLYGIRVELHKDGLLLDVWERRIGLRTMTVAREKDQWGESFCHEVNGVRIFAMGADYIPEDNILPRVTRERTYDLLRQAKDAHFNCIRVWGGGHYPGDDFWDACDELGLIVWEDFMFACSVYDLTAEFDANIRAEFADNIRRIRHHASLGLWCGNNEMELFLSGQGKDWWCRKPGQFADYIKMYEYIIPQVLKEHDPETFYWPASPSSGGSFDNPNDENRGDVHYWDVWHGNKPITEFRKFFFRYVSEFGFQSFPALKTVETFTEPEDRNIFSYVMEKHQRNQSANGKIMNYMEQTFLYPNDFDITLYASQLLQAEAMRYGVEHFRRNRGRCMGSIIWQLNDCWPVASWSMIDYEGRWKAVQYYAKRFYAPLMISCEEEGILTQDTNVNAEPYELKKSIRLCVCNESMEERSAMVRWQLRDASGQVKEAHEERVKVSPLSGLWLERVPMQHADTYQDYVSYELEEAGDIVSAGSVLFCAPKHFRFRNPALAVRAVGEDEILVTAGAYAKSVEIRNGRDDMLLEDNYFDMNPGERRLKVLKGKPEDLQVRSVYDIR